ncbi:MAG: hypothetical protein II003_03370 [Methanobrevibacter sp.]|nr:hypothetical protein [Methanobrevibacter sp.]
MNEDEVRMSSEKLLSWMESFGYKVLCNDDIKVQIEDPNGKKKIIMKSELYFINGYMFGSLVRALKGEF